MITEAWFGLLGQNTAVPDLTAILALEFNIDIIVAAKLPAALSLLHYGDTVGFKLICANVFLSVTLSIEILAEMLYI